MSLFLTPPKQTTLKSRLHEIPTLSTLVQVKAATLMPRAGGQGGGRPMPDSKPPMNVGLTDLFDQRFKLNGRASDPVASSELERWTARRKTKDKPQSKDDPDQLYLLDQDAKGRREGVLQCLESWVRLAEGEMVDCMAEHTPSNDEPTITSEAEWLAQHLYWIADQCQWVGELEQDVARIWQDLRRACGERDEYKPRCPACRSLLSGRVGFWECGACGRDYRDERMVASCQQPMTGEQIGTLFDISPNTIKTWHYTRGLLDAAVDADGKALMDGRRPKFWLIDILRLADTMGTKARA